MTAGARVPATAAGRRLLAEAIRLHQETAAEYDEPVHYPDAMLRGILAIEAEAAALNVGRLAEALIDTNSGYLYGDGGREPSKDAAVIAAEYDRLTTASSMSLPARSAIPRRRRYRREHQEPTP